MSAARALAALLCALAAGAAEPAKSEEPPARARVTLYFSDRDRTLIREYFRPRRAAGAGYPPGLAQREALQPGLQQLRGQGRLPPGLRRRPLPGELEHRLARLPPGYERVLVGGDVLLIQSATGIVLDALKDVLDAGA
ncbi:MAG TPA: hypothetical protein VNK67_14425 [Burkholderiales bacterium]|nr:hypothetical protein [Burkholderiales bacterium]